MKAILVNKQDKSLSWSDVPDPVLALDEVLVRVEYAALNRADLMQREGDYPPPAGCPEWMGLEVSGEIVEMTDGAKQKSSLKIGDKVCCLLGGGGYAEYVSVRYDMCMPVPQNCSMAEAAALPEAFATAYLKLFVEGKAKAGDILYMAAGASGLASVIIPMAKAFGLTVITSVRGDVHVIDHLHADVVVDTLTTDMEDVLREFEEKGKPVNIAIDCLGGATLGKCLPYVSYGCRWIVIAALAGSETTIDLKNIYKKNIRIVGSTLRSRTPEMKAFILSELVEKIWSKVSSGEVKPTIYKVLDIQNCEDAHAILERNENIGKVVLKVR